MQLLGLGHSGRRYVEGLNSTPIDSFYRLNSLKKEVCILTRLENFLIPLQLRIPGDRPHDTPIFPPLLVLDPPFHL